MKLQHWSAPSLYRGACWLALVVAMIFAPAPTSADEKGSTTRVSVASDGAQGNRDSFESSISEDGRYVAFDSSARNLVAGDTNRSSDVFVQDRDTGTTIRVSVASDGTQGNRDSLTPSNSADGRYVAFHSYAGNLVVGDTNGDSDVFVHDRDSGTTTRVSVAGDGAQGNGDSTTPSISAGGRYVAFLSYAGNLVAGDTNGVSDVFVHDLDTGATTRMSVAGDGTQGNNHSFTPSMSGDRYVAFQSYAGNLVAGDTNRDDDVFVHDRDTGTTTRVSVASDGTQGNNHSFSPSISGDGRYVAFASFTGTLVSNDTNHAFDVFVHDRDTGTTTRVSVASNGAQGNAHSFDPSISGDGRYVAFSSRARNLVAGDSNGELDVFVHDRDTGTTVRVSVGGNGTQAAGYSYISSISKDGRYVALSSMASKLVPNDTNGADDVFVRAIMLCSDEIDNDGDTSIDYPGDAGCSSVDDISEGALRLRDSASTVGYRKGAFRGRVSSDANGCIVGRYAIVKKARPGDDRTVGRTRAGPRGHWRVAEPHADGRFYAVIVAKLIYNRQLDTVACGAAKSRVLSR